VLAPPYFGRSSALPTPARDLNSPCRYAKRPIGPWLAALPTAHPTLEASVVGAFPSLTIIRPRAQPKVPRDQEPEF